MPWSARWDREMCSAHGPQCLVDLAVKDRPAGAIQRLQRWLVLVPRGFQVGDAGGGLSGVARLNEGQSVLHDGSVGADVRRREVRRCDSPGARITFAAGASSLAAAVPWG